MNRRLAAGLAALAIAAVPVSLSPLAPVPAAVAAQGNAGFHTLLDAPLQLAPGVASFATQSDELVAPGVRLTTARLQTSAGLADAHILTVDLRNPHVRTDLLTPTYVAQTDGVDAMVARVGALAGVNADFFNFFEDAGHPGIAPTGAASGAEIRDGKIIKSAVPPRQRFGETAPRPNTGTEVIGVTRNRTGVVGRVELVGTVTAPDVFVDAPDGMVALNALNQYGLARGDIAAFDSQWGPAPRVRATCGDETLRTKPCVTDIVEVIVRDGVVASVSPTLGAGQLAHNEIALVGREAGAARLRQLAVGDRVEVSWTFEATADYRWAVGGFVILQDGAVLSGLDKRYNPRTSAGVSVDGRLLYLITVDGRRADQAGISINDMAHLQRQVGADDAVVFDGGGSTTMAGVRPGDDSVTVWNTVSGGSVRKVANGVGVFTK